MKEKLEGTVLRCEHWSHAPRGNEYTFRWSAFVEGDGEGENLQLLSAVVKDGLGWQKVPRASAMFNDLQAGLRSFCEVNGREMLHEECEARGDVYDIESSDQRGEDFFEQSEGEGVEEQQADRCRIERAYFYTGYLSSPDLDSGRVQVDFQVSTGLHDPEPTDAEQDAGFMAALAQKFHLRQEVNSVGLNTTYDGVIESDDGYFAVGFTCPAGASAAEIDAAHLAALAQKVQIDWLLLGEKIITPVAVVGHNASGVPDVFMAQVVCEQSQFDEGGHYDLAKEQAEEQGFEPSIAFDPNDEAWKSSAWQGMQAPAGEKPVVVIDVSHEGITGVRSNMATELVVLDSTWGDPDIESIVDGASVHITKPDVMVLEAGRFAELMGQIVEPKAAPAHTESPLADEPF